MARERNLGLVINLQALNRYKTNEPSRMVITTDLTGDLVCPASVITKALDSVADVEVSENH